MVNLHKHFLFVLGLFCFLGSYSMKQDVFGVANWQDLNNRAEYKVVDLAKPNIKDALITKGYQPLSGQTLNLGFYRGGVWVRFDVYPNEGELLVLGNPILDWGVLYTLKNDSLVELQQTGDLRPFSTRYFKHRKPVFEIGATTEKRTFYLFVSNEGEQFYLPVLLWKKDDLAAFDKLESYLFGAYIGILLFVLVFNAFVAGVLKEGNIINYILYLVGLIGLQIALNGYGLKWFYGEFPEISVRVTPFFSTFSIFFLIQFTLDFLAIENHFPKLNKAFKYAGYALILNLVFTIVFPKEFLLIPIVFINITTFVFGIAIIPIAFNIYKKGYKPARYFLLAFVSLIICVFAFVLRNLGVLPNNFISENGLQIGSTLEVILITFAIVDKFKTFRDQSITRLEQINQIKSNANELLEIKVKERTKELKIQKDLVETKNEEITDSINYAKRIQNAILPSIDEVKKGVKDAFVFYRPKDIVSGDFYWVSHFNQVSVYVVADCTGHGVPGAFMSMIGNALLNQIVKEKQVVSPGEILNQLREGVIDSLSQNQKQAVQKDGMDMCVVAINKESNTIQYSGANNGLYIVKSGRGPFQENAIERCFEQDRTLFEIKPNKQPIGVYTDDKEPFTEHLVRYAAGDILYLFTDGFPDQFGGKKGKKLKYKYFRNKLLEFSSLSGNEQHYKLEQFYLNWIDAYEHQNFQVDDVCVMGLILD